MKKTNPALIMIDMQRGFIDKRSAQCVAMAEETVPACASVIDYCHAEQIPVFYVTREYLSDGSNVENTRYFSWKNGGKAMSAGCKDEISTAYPEEFSVLPQDYIIIKPRYSAFFQTSLDLILRRKGIDTVLIAGTTTPNCIRTTCYDAISLDYNAVILSDCTSSVTQQVQDANLTDMRNIGAQIITSSELISGTELLNTTAMVMDDMMI